MPSGLRKTSGNHFEIYYEQPWGGVASNKAAMDIDAGDLVKCDGVTVRNGILCFTDITAKNAIYHLNTLNPPAIPPFVDNGAGEIVEVPIVTITPTDYDYRTQVYNGRIYTVESTEDLVVGSVIGITGTTNPVGDYNFNGSDVVDAIIDATHFHTATPYLSTASAITGGTFTVEIQNNITAGVGYIPLQGGGFIAITTGTVAYNTAIPVPAGYSIANSAIFVTPGSTTQPSGNPIVSGVQEASNTSGTLKSSFAIIGTGINQAPSNYVAIFWSGTVTQTTVGLVNYYNFTTGNGDNLCFFNAANVGAGVTMTAPAGYTQADILYIAGMSGVVPTAHTMQGVQSAQLDGSYNTKIQYNDNQSNIWGGLLNVFGVFWAGSGITAEAVTGGNSIAINTGSGTTLCILAGQGLQHTQSTTLPAAFNISTLNITAAMNGWVPHGDAEAVCWSKCEMDLLTAAAVYNSVNDSWRGYVNFFGIAGTIYTPNPPAPVTWSESSYAALIFNVGPFLCCVDQYGFSYVAMQLTDGTVQWNVDQVAENSPTQNFGLPTAVKVIDGTAYISVFDTNTLYAYIPRTSYLIASTYVAGKYIEIFDEYLIQLYTNSQAKDTSDGIQPTRINWSSPDQFSQWDPGVNRTAGFQSITSASDFISGFVAVDNVGYIFRRTGITQITATGIAIQPFNFTTYWNSDIGQGLIFPGTLKQFGRFVFLTTDSAVYMFYGGSFTSISQKAAAAIFAQLEGQATINSNTNTNTTGAISVFPLNDNIPVLNYMLITTFSNTNPNLIFWFYHPDDKSWTSVSKNLYQMIQQITNKVVTTAIINFIRTSNVFLDYIVSKFYNNQPNYAVNVTLINVTYTDSDGNHTNSFVFYDIVSSPTSTSNYTDSTGGAMTLLFRQEEIKLYREPTIRRVVIVATGSGTLAVSVSGVDFGTITLLGGTDPVTYVTPYGIYTGVNPQVKIVGTNFYGQITKVMLPGTYADGEID